MFSSFFDVFSKFSNLFHYKATLKELNDLDDDEKIRYLKFWSDIESLSLNQFIFLFFEVVISKNEDGGYKNNPSLDDLSSHDDFEKIKQFSSIIRNQIESGFFQVTGNNNQLTIVNDINSKIERDKVKDENDTRQYKIYNEHWLDFESIITKTDIETFFKKRGWVIPDVFVTGKVQRIQRFNPSDQKSLDQLMAALSLCILQIKSDLNYDKPDIHYLCNELKTISDNRFNINEKLIQEKANDLINIIGIENLITARKKIK